MQLHVLLPLVQMLALKFQLEYKPIMIVTKGQNLINAKNQAISVLKKVLLTALICLEIQYLYVNNTLELMDNNVLSLQNM